MKLSFFSTRLKGAGALGVGGMRENYGGVRTLRLSLYALLWTLTAEIRWPNGN
jgi:hypothetical protein